MHLRRLHLRSFRGFEDFQIELHRSCTVVVGRNGSGKSALVSAITRALDVFPSALGVHAPPFESDDVRATVEASKGLYQRRVHAPAVVEVDATLHDGSLVSWRRARDEAGNRGVGDVSKVNQAWRAAFSRSPTEGPLPIVATYGAHRLNRDSAPSEGTDVSAVSDRKNAYQGAFGKVRRFESVLAWIRTHTFADVKSESPLPHLEGLLGALRDTLPNVEKVWYDIRSETLLVREATGTIRPYNMLSDGYLAMLSVVADLAWRCIVANPELGAEAPSRTPGVVAIDEVELHLHPAWQWRCLDDLTRVFPAMQFIVTTHSAQVVATAPAECVQVLSGATAIPVAHANGLDANAILREVFGVNERPAAMVKALAKLASLADRGATEEANALLAELEDDLGEDAPELTRVRWLMQMNGVAG
jgi:predicted ATP-binding protein involved in virulence